MDGLIGMDLGRYHILEPLGQGGMATVYKAYDTLLERDVAVKIIRTELFGSAVLEKLLKRFEREAKALARLIHPNIVSVIDYGEHDGEPYLVMPYLPGGTLKQCLGKPIPWQEAVRLLLPISRALQYAHGQSIIHRDIKPSNILLTPSGEPMLTDFGIAKILDLDEGQTLTGTGVGVGTPEYMAPEQWTGKTTPQSDVYSLGVVFYEMVTGKKPYTADTPAAVLLKQANNPLPPPRQFVTNLPEAVERVLYKALAKQPEDRYPTMGDFANALNGLMIMESDQTIVAPKPEAEISPETRLPEEKQASQIAQPETKTLLSPVLPEQGEVGKTKPEKPSRRIPRLVWISGAIVLGIAAIGILSVLFFRRGTIFLPAVTPTTALVQVNTVALPAAVLSSPVPTSLPATATPVGAANQVAPDCKQANVFCVGFVSDVGKIDDKSFNQTAWEGVQLAQQNGDADWVQYLETSDSAYYDKNIAIFAETGYKVIVTWGFALTDATYNAAKKYPKILFIGGDQYLSKDTNHPDWPLPNLVGIVYQEDQSGFLVGMLAAEMSQSHRIGAICGTDAVPAVWRYGEGFRAGATFADAKFNLMTDIMVVYHNDVGYDKTFTDPDWGAAMANTMVDKGADVIFGCGGRTGNGALAAAAQRKVYVIGVDTDQYFTLPEAAPQMLSSAMKMETPAVADMIKAARSGKFPGSGLYYGLSGYAPYHDLAGKVPAEVDAAMQSIFKSLTDGSLKTNVSSAKPTQ